MRLKISFVVCFFCGLVILAEPQEGRIPEPSIGFAPFKYVCSRTMGPIRIDGRLDEESWMKAEWTEVFGDIEGNRKPTPRFRTRAQMLWDDDYFYIGAYLEEPNIWATLTQRDSILFQENDFEVFIDPDGDTHNYYELEINALNTVWDLLLIKPYRDGGPAVHSWDIQGLKTGVHIMGTVNDPRDKDKAWTVEIALPFAVLRECIPGSPERPRSGDQWRVNFSRVEYWLDLENGAYVKSRDTSSGQPLPEDNWTWVPQGMINVHYPELWGYVQFSARLAGRRSERFNNRSEERVKWALRRIYYRQWAFYDKNGKFANALDSLGLEDDRELRIRGWGLPSLQITRSQFEAFYSGSSGDSWHIRQDGLVWKEEADREPPKSRTSI